MGKKKGKKPKPSLLTSLLKVTGDLSEDRVKTLLYGYDFLTHSAGDDCGSVSHNEDDNIVKKRRHIAPQTKHFSEKIEERAASPVVSPRYGLR
jgi:hypothetical protein